CVLVVVLECFVLFFFFSSRRRHTRFSRDWSSDVCSSDLKLPVIAESFTGTGESSRDIKTTTSDKLIQDAASRYADKNVDESQIRSEERRVGKECRLGWAVVRL